MKVQRQVRNSIKTCDGLSGPILGILDRLNPAVDIVVSGHTHQSYICDYATKNPAKPFLLTSAGQYGTLITDIKVELDGKTGDIIKKMLNKFRFKVRPILRVQPL